ncbi:MAG: hypothetical protein B6I35_08575 [Anaerolineaceae bacterium 4572_32.2]|nr:MAG: hypothetical protein B6I35_08575 [Anaerolineaceae bacterium 4572_32.2]
MFVSDVLGIESAIAIVIVLLSVPLLFYALSRTRTGHKPNLRPLPAFDLLAGMSGRAAESNRVLHVGLGMGGISGPDTAVSLAGLTALEYLADQAALSESRLVVTVANPTLLPAAQEVLRRAYAHQGKSEIFTPSQVRLLAPDKAAYAAGVMDILEGEDPLTNVTIGAFGDEYLLIGETGAKKGLEQVAGTDNPAALAFMYAIADETLIGEEIFAAGAYLHGDSESVAGIIVQDWWRYLVVLIIIAGVLWQTLL